MVFALYANVLPNPFVWDDNIFIVQNQFIRHWKNLPLLFKSDFFGKSPEEASFSKGGGGYYRPIVMVLYTLEYHLWGDHPFGYHLVSILLHLLNVFLVYRLLQRLFQNGKVSFLGALLFASHPLHTEAISYLPSRGDLLGAFFCLTSLLLYRSHKQILRGSSLLLFAMALLSKESAVIFPALLLVMDLSEPDGKGWKEKTASFPYMGFVFLYVAVRLFFFPFRANPWIEGDPGFFLRTLSSGKVMLSYLALLLFPYPLHLERTAPFQTTFWDFGTLLFILAATGVVLLGRVFWKKNRSLFFGTAWFFIALAPVVNILSIHPSMAEHYLYFPSIGVFMVAAFCFYQFFTGVEKKADRRILLTLGYALLSFWGFVIIQRNRDYSDEMKLFAQTAIQSPQSPLMHNNLGSVYMYRGFVEEAAREFERSLSLKPDQAIVWGNLGTVYKQKKEYEKAIQLFKKALEYNEEDAVIWNKLGIAYAESGSAEAEKAFLQAIHRNPGFADAYFNLGSYYWKKGEFKKAALEWEKGLKKAPDHPLLNMWLSLSKEKLSKEK